MSNLNVVEAVRFYINRMIDESGQGVKGLVMDKETASIVSMVYAQSEILQKEIFLFERVDVVAKQPLKHITAICLLRPNEENIQTLIRELRQPKYYKYFIYFTNPIDPNHVKSLADADDFECVQSIEELYADYLAVNPHLYSLNIPITYQKHYDLPNSIFLRTVEGLLALLLSLRKKNVTIRYQKSSTMTKLVAERLCYELRRQSDLGSSSNSTESNQTDVLIIDRREDAVTPLLNQWNYQAMIHELIGIKNNRVNLSQVPGITKELEEVIMSAEYDEFYAKNLYSNFGEIATNIKELMEHFQERHKSQSKIESINDMKAFVETYPQFKKLSGTVTKHVTVVGELSRLVSAHQLLEVSETEQNLVCQNDHNEIIQKIKHLIHEKKVRDEDILRLLCLYALRYERHSSNELNALKHEVQKYRRFPEKYFQFITALLDYGGQKFRQSDIFHVQKPLATTRQLFRGLRGVDNVYAQHIPLIKDLLEQLLRGKLKDTFYPSVTGRDPILTSSSNQLLQQGQVNKPNEVIVYVIGGVTYEESFHIHAMNKQGARIVLGGSFIHNFSSFIDEVLVGFVPQNPRTETISTTRHR